MNIGDILWLPLKNLKPWVNTWDKALISVGVVSPREEHEFLYDGDEDTLVEDDNQDDSFCFTEDDPYSVREIEQCKITDGRDAEAHLDLVFTTLVDNLQALDINNAPSLQATRRVQGDVFHMMKRPRPASKHSF